MGSVDIDLRADGRLCRDRLSIEPDVFHASAAKDAVYHDRETLDIWLPAYCAPIIKDDRPGAVLGQLSFDLPYQLLALYRIGLGGLPFDTTSWYPKVMRKDYTVGLNLTGQRALESA